MRFTIIISFILILAVTSLGQYYFGKNKIQYADYDWQYLQTEHFDIYFFEAESRLSRITAYEAEKDWEDFVGRFRFVPREKIPIIIYPAPNLFQETNTIPWILPEGVGGFTEYYKGRVVLPFNGRYRDFRHTLKHELVHAFIMHKNIFVHDNHDLFFLSFLPLWIEEGMAEHFSERTSREMEMVLRSGILQQDFVPIDRIWEIYGSFLMYKEAEAFLLWLAEEYGENRITEILEDMHDFSNFEEMFQAHFGLPLKAVSAKWENYMHEKYWPLILDGELPDENSRMLTSKKEGINLSAELYRGQSDSIPSVYFQSSRMGYAGIYKYSPGKSELIVKGGFSEDLEQMHFFENHFSISNNGVMVFSVKKKGGDVLTFFDIEKKKILMQRQFKAVPGITSPEIYSNATKVVFAGTSISGFDDIFVYYVKEDSLVRLNQDIYFDSDPVFIDDYIYFSSDRVEGGDELGFMGICRIPIGGGIIEELTGIQANNVQLTLDSSKYLLFSSDFEKNIQNVWRLDLDSMKAYRITNILTGLFEPKPFRGDSIIASVYTKSSYQLGVFPGDSIYYSVEVEWQPWVMSWSPGEKSVDYSSSKIGYDTKLSFDIAQGAIATNTSMESAGGIEGVFSDMLGDRQIYFMVYDQGQSLEDLLKNLNVAAMYYDMSDKPVWGVGGFHLYVEGYNRYDFGFSEETFGLTGMLSYPFSRFLRMDANSYLMYSKKSYFADIQPKREGAFGSLNLSLIRDNSLWGSTGPVEGFRGNATVGGTYRFDKGELSSYLTSADLRYYFRVSKRMSIALRTVGRSSGGNEPDRFWMGGTWDFRGYPFFYFYGRNLLFTSLEFRFPLLDSYRMKFPFLDVNLHGIKGALFFDTGQTWEDDWQEPLASVGYGIRMPLGGVTVIRFDVSWKTDYHSGFEKPYYDIFFGWDF